MSLEALSALYIVPAFIIMLIYKKLKAREESKNEEVLGAEVEAGLTEPASLHPHIDPVSCIGCGACVTACPEGDILGLIGGKSELIKPTHCIGHGACAAACPMGAITLVLGTEKRGLEIPVLKPTFETSMPGIYIAGELGGMGLIRNAVEQGKQAIGFIQQSLTPRAGHGENIHDVIIIGAGPAGFSSTLAAHEKKLSYLTIEQEILGGTVAHYPRGKIVMTSPANLPIVGKTPFTTISKEDLIKFWKKIEGQYQLNISYGEKVENITRKESYFEVITTNGVYNTRAVLLTIGRRGTPRKLGVLGEDKTKVVYRLIDPEQYAGKHVLVVGGGDSALEAAASLSEQPATTVTLSYRGEAFGRSKQKNRERIAHAEKEKRLKVLLSSQVKEITDYSVIISVGDECITFTNDIIVVCAGGELPTPFLKKVGIEVETKYGTA